MELLFHESIHVTSAFIAAFIVWKKYKNFLFVLSVAFLAGVLIDVDHVIDYFMAFGLSFNLDHFFKGYQFLKTDKLYIFFHGYEYVVVLGIIFLLIKKNTKLKLIILSLTIAMFFHLVIDSVTNRIYVRSYFILGRVSENFDLKKLVYPEHYVQHQKLKQEIFPKE